MWAGPAVGTLDPNRNSRQRRMRGRRGVRVLVAPVGPAHDLQFACALVRSTGGASRIESARQRFAHHRAAQPHAGRRIDHGWVRAARPRGLADGPHRPRRQTTHCGAQHTKSRARRLSQTALAWATGGRWSLSGVLAAWRPRAGRKLDLATRRVFATPVATEVWPEVASAAGVKGEAGWAARGGVVAVAPFHEHDQGGPELASFVGEQVLRPAGSLWVRNAFEQLLVA